jgi:D-alanine transfer protein
MKAFLAAFLLFAVTVLAVHIVIGQRVAVNNPAFSTWSTEEKSRSLTGISENINEGTMLVFGSSEFQHGTDTIYHPSQVFAGNRFNPMLIGAGYYQSLSHAITLAALEPYLTQRKAVLILSPQWFRKTGVVDQAYASRFSETLYAGMLENDRLSDETKTYLSDRTCDLLQVDETMREHVLLHNKVLWKKNGSFLEELQENFWNSFLAEKERFSMALLEQTSGIQKGEGIAAQDEEPDWDALLTQAQADGEKENQNEFYINDTSYKLLEAHLAEKKDMNKDAVKGYQKSPEYDDLRSFLQVCQELDIEPMLVILPVNGYYYDYTGFPKEAREGYYEKVRGVADEYGVKVADFSDQEYTQYFFEDRVHLGKKGWVMINESLYEFYKED